MPRSRHFATIDQPARCLVLGSCSVDELLVDRYSFLSRDEGFAVAAQFPQAVAEPVQRHFEVGQVGVRVGLGKLPTDRCSFLSCGKGHVVAAQFPQQDPEVVQRQGEVGQVGGGVGLGEMPLDGLCLPSRCEGLVVAAQF
jgi:hypothetical protein